MRTINFSAGIVILLAILLGGCASFGFGKDDDDAPSPSEKEMQLAESAYLEGNYRAAAGYLYPLAQAGDPDAQYALGFLLYDGLGVPQDRMQAYFWIQEAARQGNSSALLALELFEADPDLPIDEENKEDIEGL